MAAPGAFIMRNAATSFDSTAYNSQLTKAELVPDTAVEQLKLLDGGTASDVDDPSWTFQIAGVQDHVATQGLANFLRVNHGAKVEVEFQARPGVGQQIATFDVVAMAPNFGGEQGSWALMELELPVDGEVVWSVSI